MQSLPPAAAAGQNRHSRTAGRQQARVTELALHKVGQDLLPGVCRAIPSSSCRCRYVWRSFLYDIGRQAQLQAGRHKYIVDMEQLLLVTLQSMTSKHYLQV
jgi:hypothetical protein